MLPIADAQTQTTDRTAPAEGAAARTRELLPGAALAGAVAVAATVVGGRVPVVGAPVIAIVTGIAIVAIRRPGARLCPGIAFTG